jgi:protein TonB
MVDVPAPEVRCGFLRDCLVAGDPAQEKRVRRNKQRALLISIVLQILIVAALVLFPLLSKGENIAGGVIIIPRVPYVRGVNHPHPEPMRPAPDGSRAVCHFCQPNRIPVGIVIPDPARIDNPPDSDGLDIPGVPEGTPDGVPFNSLGLNDQPPNRANPTGGAPVTPRRIRVTSIEPAMLIRRVEPAYPPLARQLRREGRVELHAIIGTDGSIQSLEIISGDPLLIRSALEAVGEWRYRPTFLNGQAVEVDTHITVIYTLSH